MLKPIVAGNWKMNNDFNQTQTLILELKKTMQMDVNVMIAPSFTNLSIAKDLLLDSKIEDQIRTSERSKDFGESFISLARNVYFNNDKRSKIKFEINKVLGSNIKEIKQYVNY